MRNNETGEFELVVGNRQLISAFFIVVLLFAVAFAMGYVVGQNSPRSAKLGEAASAQGPGATQGPGAGGGPANAAGTPSGTATAATDARAQPSPPAQSPAPAPAQTVDNSAAAPGAAPGGTTPAAATPAPPEAGAAPTAAPPADAPAGTYWQVMAVNPVDAEVVVRTLKEKGFPASMTPGPNSLMRVLVGPYSDTQSMGRAKTELEREGFHPIRH